MVRRQSLRLAGAVVALLVALEVPAQAVPVVVQNDSWPSGGEAVFQNGFVSGEIAAVRLSPTVPCLCRVWELQVLFGGSSGTRNATLKVWKDESNSLDPGSLVLTRAVSIPANSSTLYTLDLSAIDFDVTGPFRVGVQFSASGLPGAAIDSDETINDAKNFVYSDGKWWPASDFGLDGDWIVRAKIESEMATICGQPVSNGDKPVASDALYILRGAVGQLICNMCLCDTNDSGDISASDALRALRAAVGQNVTLECGCSMPPH